MGKKRITPHFGGLWAVVGEPPDDRKMRTALHFFGTEYLVFLDFEKPNLIEQSMYHYVLDEGEMSLQQLWGDETKDMPIVEAQWRFIEGRLLEFVEGGKMSRWEPVTVEDLVEEGYPMRLFESLRRQFTDIGSFYTIEGLVPDSSVFAAVRKKSKRRK